MGKDLKGKELGEGIYQRKDGSYCGRYYDRFNKRKSVYANSIREVRRKLTQAMAQDAQLRSIRGEVTLDNWFVTWLNVYKKNSVRQNTLREYDYIYRHDISPKLGSLKLTEIYKTHVQELINDLHEAGYGYERQNKTRIIMIDICNRAIEDQFLVVNPARGVRIRAKKPKNKKALSPEEQKDFFDYAYVSFFYNAFQVQVNTGLRPGELFALTSEDIDIKNRIIDVKKTLVYQQYLEDKKKTFHEEDPKTDSSFRKIPINTRCMYFLKEQMSLKEMLDIKFPTGCPYLFVSSVNNPICSQVYNDAIDAVVRQINYKRSRDEEMRRFSGHLFRHTFATRCFEAGISPKVVQGYLGHASLKMTMDLYTSVMDDRAARDIETICDDNDGFSLHEQLKKAQNGDDEIENIGVLLD